MIDLPPTITAGVFGPVCSGKTYLVKQWLQRCNRGLAFDYVGEFEGEPGVDTYFARPKDCFVRMKSNPYYFKIAYVPSPKIELEFQRIQAQMYFIHTHKILFCDEFHRIAPVNRTPDEVETMLRFSRKARIGLVGVSQRIADVSKLFTSACRMVVLFQTNEARDLDAIDDRWGCAEQVQNLQRLIHDDSTGNTSQSPSVIVYEQGKGIREEKL